MKPGTFERTMELRYVSVWINDDRTTLVLQQRWVCIDADGDEHEDWREIPLVGGSA